MPSQEVYDVYVRQSIDNAEGIERQIERCTRLIESRGAQVGNVYADNDTSASKTRGTGTDWARMLADEPRPLVAVDLDRLLRGVGDLVTLIGTGRSVVTVDGELDLTTADGEFRATMLAGIARFEVRRKSERQRRATEYRVANGLPVPGKRRYGFKLGNVQAEPEEAALVLAAYEGVAAGDSVRSWAARIGKPTVRVREILTNPAYAGWIVHHGERYEADESVARIVPRELWETVQVLLNDPRRKTTPGNQPRHLASGIARCGTCKGPMSKVGPNYICPGGKKGHACIKVELVDAKVIRHVQLGLALWRDYRGDDTRAAEARQRIEELEEAIRTAQDLALSPGADVAHLKRRIAEMSMAREAEVEELSRALNDTLPLSDVIDVPDAGLEGADLTFRLDENDFAEGWKSLGIERQRELVRRLVARLEVHTGRGDGRVKVDLWLPPGLELTPTV